MKSLLTLLALALVVSTRLSAAAPAAADLEREAVLQVVQQFFDALHAKDAALLASTCQPGAQFSSIRPAPEGTVVRARLVETDVAQIAESKEVWLERMWAPTVHIEGRIAVVWTRYDFHRDGKLSHNGTDCFTLLKTDQGWKIVNGAYTVEPSARTENPAGPPK